MALGAQRRDVMRMMLGDVVRMLALGFVAGVPAAAAATRLVSSQIFGMRAAAPASFALAIVVLGIVALATGFVPVRRATRLDPLIALRDE